MADSFKLTGSYTSIPLFGVQSAFPTISAPIEEYAQLGKRFVDTLQLEDESVTSVNLGGLSAVNVLLVKAVGGPIRLTLVSGLGTALIPVETFFTLFTISSGITAISVQRSPGVETFVEVFMGQSA